MNESLAHCLVLALLAGATAYGSASHATRTTLKTWHPSISGNRPKQTPAKMAIANISTAKLDEVMGKLFQIKRQTGFPHVLLAQAVMQIFNRPFEVNKVSERSTTKNEIKYQLKADIEPSIEFSAGDKDGASAHVTLLHFNRAIRHMLTGGTAVRKTIVGETSTGKYHIARDTDARLMNQGLTALDELTKEDVLEQRIALPIHDFLSSKRSIPIVYSKVTQMLTELAKTLQENRPTVTANSDDSGLGVRVVGLGKKGSLLQSYETRFDPAYLNHEVFVDWFAPGAMEAQDATFEIPRNDERSMKRLISRYDADKYLGVREGNTELGATRYAAGQALFKTEIHEPDVGNGNKPRRLPPARDSYEADQGIALWKQWLEYALAPQLASPSSRLLAGLPPL